MIWISSLQWSLELFPRRAFWGKYFKEEFIFFAEKLIWFILSFSIDFSIPVKNQNN